MGLDHLSPLQPARLQTNRTSFGSVGDNDVRTLFGVARSNLYSPFTPIQSKDFIIKKPKQIKGKSPEIVAERRKGEKALEADGGKAAAEEGADALDGLKFEKPELISNTSPSVVNQPTSAKPSDSQSFV